MWASQVESGDSAWVLELRKSNVKTLKLHLAQNWPSDFSVGIAAIS